MYWYTVVLSVANWCTGALRYSSHLVPPGRSNSYNTTTPGSSNNFPNPVPHPPSYSCLPVITLRFLMVSWCTGRSNSYNTTTAPGSSNNFPNTVPHPPSYSCLLVIRLRFLMVSWVINCCQLLCHQNWFHFYLTKV